MQHEVKQTDFTHFIKVSIKLSKEVCLTDVDISNLKHVANYSPDGGMDLAFAYY